MSSSISAMADRGWVRRAAPEKDRRAFLVEVTPTGRAALDRVSPLRRGAPGGGAGAARFAVAPPPAQRAGGLEESLYAPADAQKRPAARPVALLVDGDD